MLLQTHESVKSSVQPFITSEISKWLQGKISPKCCTHLHAFFPRSWPSNISVPFLQISKAFKKIFFKYLSSFSGCSKWESRSKADHMSLPEIEVSPLSFSELKSLNNILLDTTYLLKGFIFMMSVFCLMLTTQPTLIFCLSDPPKTRRLTSAMPSILLRQHDAFQPSSTLTSQHLSLLISPSFSFLKPFSFPLFPR